MIPCLTPCSKPVGYVEVQKSWIGVSSDGAGYLVRDAMEGLLLHEVALEQARENPTFKKISSHVTSLQDGNGVWHYTLYVGYAPGTTENSQPAEPLNPRDLNGAGNTNMGDPARDNFMGAREQKF